MSIKEYISKKEGLFRNLTSGFSKPLININIVREQVHDIERFLELNNQKSVLVTAFRDAFRQWLLLMRMQEDQDAAKKVLDLYYQQGKMKDTLESVKAFVQQIHQMPDADTARLMGYNNYVYMLKYQMGKMQEKYQQSQNKPFQMDIVNKAMVLQFIRSECYAVTAVKDLPKALDAGLELIRKNQKGEDFTGKDAVHAGMIADAVFFKNRYTDDDIQELKRLSISLGKQRQVISSQIRESEDIYTALTQCLTEEWFEKLNPGTQENPIRNMEIHEIQMLYQEFMKDIEEQILSKYRQ